MATRKLVVELTKSWISFSQKRLTNEEGEIIVKQYLTAFKSYKDSEISEAAERYTESNEYFPPKPAQIISLIRDASIKKHDRELVEMWTCKRCHEKVSCISTSGICGDCQGLPVPSYENLKPWPDHTPYQYKIEGRIRCQRCGAVGQCIKDPADDGQWLCRDCYSGLTTKERMRRFTDLARMMSDKDYKPDWAVNDVPF